MHEVQWKPAAASTNDNAGRTVELLVRSRSFILSGAWQWDLHSDAVFCSDVMLPAPAGFEGTRSIVHPDDLESLLASIGSSAKEPSLSLSFRIITTYGEIKRISGEALVLEENDLGSHLVEEALREYQQEQEKAKLAEHERLRRDNCNAAEGITRTGTWYYNKSNGETWYSDAVFRLHGVIPQSLNSHLNTFHSFLHPEERMAVLDALDTAISKVLPLQIEYRVILPDDSERLLKQNITWGFSEKGETVLHGVLQDVTERHGLESELETAIWSTDLQKQLLHFAEGATGMAYWQLNVVTRKLVFSDNYYRIFGLKPQSIPASSSTFSNFIHPDDRDVYEEVMHKIRKEHLAPEIEFRIIRPDGKIRYVKQKGKAIVGGDEMMMIGTIEDITVQKGLEKKLAELQENIHIKTFINRQAEAIAGIGNWFWNIKTGEITWSDHIYELLGQKPQQSKLTPKMLQRAIHPEDQKKFADELGLVFSDKKESDFTFRLISKGAVLYMRTSFRILSYDSNEFFIGTVQDVTAEEVSRRDLTERVRLLELLSDSIPDIILMTDDDNNVVLWNRRCEERFGIKREKAVGGNLFDILPQLKEGDLFRHFNAALAGEKLQLANLQPPPPLRGFYNVSLVPLRNDDDKVVGVLHLLHDVTAAHRMHLQLTSRLQFIEKLMEASVDRIISLDRNMNYLYWNRKAEKYYGLKKETVIGKNILEIFPRHQKLPSYAQFREALRGQMVHIPIDSRETEDFTETYLIPVPNEKGEADSILWIVHDLSKEYELIKQQRAAQAQLHEEHRRLEEAQAIGRIGSFEWTVGETAVVWSDEMYRLNGREPQSEIITADETDNFIHPDDREKVLQLKQTSLLIPGFYQIEHRIVLPDSSVKWVTHRFESIANEEGKVVRVHGTLQDITERKKAEEEARANQELLAATMDASLDMIQVFKAVRDENGEIVDFRYLLINHEAEKWMPDVIGKSLLQAQPGVVAEGIFDAFKQVVETGVSQQYERHYAHEQFNGWYYQSVVKLNDGVATTTSDITERKKAEEEVLRLKDEIAQQATNKYSTLFNSIDEGFSIIDLIHDDNGNLVDFVYSEINPAFIRHVGVDLRGKRRSELSIDKKDFVLEKYDHLAKTGEPLHFEHHVQALGGQWFQVSGSRIGGEGSTQLGVVFRNITERKQQEEKQAYLLKLSDATRSLSNPDEILNEALKTVAEYLNLDRIGYNEINADVTEYWYRACYAREGFAPVLGRFQMGPFKETVRNLQKGITFIARDAYAESFSEAEKSVHRSLNVGAYVTVPLVKDGRWVCNIVAHYSKPRNWTKHEIEILEETAERIWAAVERAKAEEALRLSEERLQLATSAAKIGTYLYYPLEDRGEPDDQALALFGLKRDGVLNLAAAMLHNIHAEDRERHMKAVMAALDPSSNGKADTEFRVVHPDGSIRWLHSIAKAYFEGDPPLPTKMPGVVVDITERKEAEEALRQSETNLTALFTAMPIGVALVDMEGKIIVSNAEMTRFLPTGFVPSMDPERASRWTGYYPDGRVVEVENYPGRRAMRGETGGLVEFLYKADDGTEIWTHVNYLPVKDAEGNVTRFVCVITDIDQLKRNADALRQSEEQFRLLVTATSNSVYKMSPDWKLMYNLVGKDFLADTSNAESSWMEKYIPKQERSKVKKAIAEAIEKKTVFDLEHQVYDATGNIAWVHSRAIPKLNAQGLNGLVPAAISLHENKPKHN